jgi:hypothetical protein
MNRADEIPEQIRRIEVQRTQKAKRTAEKAIARN